MFVGANGDRLAFNYGGPGTFTIIPQADGQVVVRFVATFTPVPGQSTGRFADVTGGSITLVATILRVGVVSPIHECLLLLRDPPSAVSRQTGPRAGRHMSQR